MRDPNEWSIECLKAEARFREEVFGKDRLEAERDDLVSPETTTEFVNTVTTICGPSFYDDQERRARWLYRGDAPIVRLQQNHDGAFQSLDGDELFRAKAVVLDVRRETVKALRGLPRMFGAYAVRESIFVSHDQSHAQVLRRLEPRGLLAHMGVLQPKVTTKFATETEVNNARDTIMDALIQDDNVKSMVRGPLVFPTETEG